MLLPRTRFILIHRPPTSWRTRSSIHNAQKHHVNISSVFPSFYLPRNCLSTTTNDPPKNVDTPIKPTTTTLTKSLLSLSKARLSLLVVSTSTLGFLSAGPAALLSIPQLLSVTTGTALCSASASTFNQIFEIDRDSRMKRTSNRVLVNQSLSKEHALLWGGLTGVSGGMVLGMGTDVTTTLLGVGNIMLYSGVYTWLKPRSEWNTWVGAVVGAVPPVMGWTAAGGSLMDPEAIILGSTLFLWQFPHFFALNWMYRSDYKRGGFAMVATNDPNGDRTAKLITRYAMYLSSIPILSSVFEITSPMFAVEGIVLNAYALHVANTFDKERSNANARKVFLTSLWYLPCVMMLFILHSRRWHEDVTNKNFLEEEGGKSFYMQLEEIVHKIQARGRELCIHEAIASKDLWIGSKDSKTPLDESKCPIALNKRVCKGVDEKVKNENVSEAAEKA